MLPSEALDNPLISKNFYSSKNEDVKPLDTISLTSSPVFILYAGEVKDCPFRNYSICMKAGDCSC